MNFNRRDVLKLAGIVGVSPLAASTIFAEENCPRPCPPCPHNYIYLEVHNECYTIAGKTYRTCRRYRVRACYQLIGNAYKVSIPGLPSAFRFRAVDPASPSKGLRVVLFCLYIENCKVKKAAGIPTYGWDCVPECRFGPKAEQLQLQQQGVEVLGALCRVACADGTEAWIPANDPDACFDCPNEGCLKCDPGVKPKK